MNKQELEKIKQKALEEHIPIIMDDTLEVVDKILKEVKPKLAIMTHFGLKMLSIDPIDEAKRITKETGVKTLAAFDGMSFEVNTQNPARIRIKTLKDVNSQIHSSNIDLNRRERKNTYQSSLKNGENDELTIGKN